MLNNALSMLLFWTRSLRVNDAPVFYTHKLGNETYQVIVVRMADLEAAVA